MLFDKEILKSFHIFDRELKVLLSEEMIAHQTRRMQHFPVFTLIFVCIQLDFSALDLHL